MTACVPHLPKPCRPLLLAMAVAGWLSWLDVGTSGAEQAQLDVLGGRVAEVPAGRMIARYLRAAVQ